jgi:dihydrofolate synthase/folylpolyglutamate synthase
MSKINQNQNLSSFLNKKELFYNKIDYNVILQSWNILKHHITLPYVIHIVGTNGKGSTGRYLAHILYEKKYKVLHYSSPHILEFNERIWINGKDSTNEQLESAHIKLQKILPINILNKLTYFEYTTLLAFVLSDSLDYLVLEAGLGGEFDATNVVKNNLSLFTTIGYDHTEFLGNTIEKIVTTKIKSCNNGYIFGKQIFQNEITKVKNKILKEKLQIPLKTNFNLPNEALNLPEYLKDNLYLALSALKYLNIDIDNFTIPRLFGRYQKLTSNITIDVGHNTLAATVLLNEFKNQKVILVYNSYKDKNYQQILENLKPIIKKVQILKINDDRMIKYVKLKQICEKLNIVVEDYKKINTKQKYLVFGSFKVVEEFLKRYKNENIQNK